MALHRDNPLTAQDTRALAPLANSHEADQLEADLKALFIQLFEERIRPAAKRVGTSGAPHLGPFEQIEQAVKAEGLSLVRKEDEAPMRYAFKAWRARNPKRGLHMLRIYLQMLWPNGWKAEQLWMPAGGTYPTDAVSKDTYAASHGGADVSQAAGYFLTSRVNVEISGSATDGSDVLQVAGAMRSVIPARMVLYVTVVQRSEASIGMAPVYYVGCYQQSFEGTVR